MPATFVRDLYDGRCGCFFSFIPWVLLRGHRVTSSFTTAGVTLQGTRRCNGWGRGFTSGFTTAGGRFKGFELEESILLGLVLLNEANHFGVGRGYS